MSRPTLPDWRSGAGWRFLVGVLLGLAGVACFEPFGQFWLQPVLLAALFLLLQTASTARQAALGAFGWGVGLYLGGFSWVYVSLSVFGGMPFWLAGPATLLFCAGMALFPALAGALWQRLSPEGFWWRALSFAAAFCTLDWLRGWILTGFPWLTVGYAQTAPSPLAGFAPLFGVHGLSFLVLLLGALLTRWRIGLVAALLFGGLGQALLGVSWTTPAGAPISVALVQGNVAQDLKFRPEMFERTLAHYHDLVERHPAQLTVLPETALPAFFDQLPPAYIDELARLARRLQGDLLIGAVLGDDKHYWNAAVSVGTSPLQVYSKRHLVPFGEMIPPGFAWFVRMADIPMSSFSPGPEAQAPLQVAGQNLTVNICYEDIFGEEMARHGVAGGIQVNLSNTAWFGRSWAQPQHLQMARLRAAESGRPMLRATNTGMTAVIGPDGQVQAVLEPFTSGVLQAEVTPYQGLTPYLRWRDWPVMLLCLGGLLVAAIRRRQP